MPRQAENIGMLVLGTLALLLAAPLRAATPHPTLVLQVGHSGAINTLAYSPDGQTLATGGDDNTVRLWDVPTGQLKVTLNGGATRNGAQGFAFSPDGKTLATVTIPDYNGNFALRLWDVASGQLKATLTDTRYYDGRSPPFAFSPDGKTLATGSDDGVRLWDVASGQLKATLKNANGPLVFSPDGKTLATGGEDHNGSPAVQLWDATSGQIKATLGPALRNVETLAFSPDGQTLANGGLDDDSSHKLAVQLWDVASGRLKATLKPSPDFDSSHAFAASLAFSSDGKTLAIGVSVAGYMGGTFPGPVLLWDVGSGLRKMGFDGALGPFAFSPDSKTLATAGFNASTGISDGTVQLWDVASGQLKAAIVKGANAVGDTALSPDGKMLATRDGWGHLHLWDVVSGQLKATLDGVFGQFAFLADGQTLATSGNGLQLWDVASGQLKATLKGAYSPLAFSPDSKTLATVSYDGTTRVYSVQLWDVASGKVEATLPGDTGVVGELVFSPDSQTLATARFNQKTTLWTVQLWDVASGQLKAAIVMGVGNRFAFSPDSKTLATDSYDSRTHVGVQLWDVGSGQLKATLKGAYSPLAFSPDSKTLATYYVSTTYVSSVQLWDVGSGQLKATLKDVLAMPGAPGPALAFSSDSKTLAARDASRHLHLWDVASASPITLTAQTSLAQFPPWLTHPFSWDENGTSPEVSLLDPIDEHVLATLQALPDAPASLLAPPPDPTAAAPTGNNWITTTPDGYFEGSANLAPFIRWNVDGVLYPAAAYSDVYYRPDLVQQALQIPGG